MGKYLKKDSVLFFTTMIVNVISAAASVFIAILLQKILDAALKGDTGPFVRILIAAIVYFVVVGLLMYLYSLCEKRLTCNVLRSMRADIFSGIMRHTIADFATVNTADYLSALNNDVKLIEENYIKSLLETVQNVVLFLASLAIMIYFDPIVTLCVIGSSLLMLIVPSLFGKALQKRQSAFSDRMSDFVIQLKDYLSGFEILKTYGMRAQAFREFEVKNKAVTEAKFRADKLLAANEAISFILAIFVQAVSIFLSAYFVITGRITAGTMLGLIQSSNLVNPIVMILQSIPKITGSKPIIEKVEKIANYEDVTFTGVESPSFQRGLLVQNLSFCYQPDIKVLDQVSLQLMPGKKYAVVGKSGCGKTTLIRLLMGYYENFSGEILLDGTELKQLDIEKLYSLSAMIHQNVYMFDDTILNNICLHQPFAKEEIERALRISGVSRFLNDTTTLTSTVGENGANLSGGQRQRIAVARALIQKKPIMVLDEGTSAIDMKTAYEIESGLLSMDELTLITITHVLNPDLLKAYDQILFMEDGRISAAGTYEQLQSTTFADYCNMQEA